METRNVLKANVVAAFITIIIAAVVMRIVPHPPNVAPVTALALFSGATLTGWWKFVVPMAIMIVSDLIIGLHGTMGYVYGSFLLITILGKVLRINKSMPQLVSVSLVSSILFFLITNFGVWAASEMYAKTPTGLMESYTMGIPFFRNTIFGDLIYTVSTFSLYEYAVKPLVRLRFAKHKG